MFLILVKILCNSNMIFQHDSQALSGVKCRRKNSCKCIRVSVLLCSVGFSFELIETQHISTLPCDNCVGYQLCYFVTRYSELGISLLSFLMLAFAGATDQSGILAKSTDSKKKLFPRKPSIHHKGTLNFTLSKRDFVLSIAACILCCLWFTR